MKGRHWSDTSRGPDRTEYWVPAFEARRGCTVAARVRDEVFSVHRSPEVAN